MIMWSLALGVIPLFHSYCYFSPGNNKEKNVKLGIFQLSNQMALLETRSNHKTVWKLQVLREETKYTTLMTTLSFLLFFGLLSNSYHD